MRTLQQVRSFTRGLSTRGHATYGTMLLSHNDMLKKYGNKSVDKDELQLLEVAEDRISRWRLNGWEFRVPPLTSAKEKEQIMLQQDILKSLCITRSQQLESIFGDINLVASITGVAAESVREKNRAWLQEEASRLRWKGDINRAKELRDAFLRLEVYGSKDFRLLERLCCMYGLGMQGTFEDAFSNTIVEDPITKKVFVEEGNPFTELLSHIVSRYPHIDIIYDFLGFNPSNGYRGSLKRFMTEVLRKRNNVGATLSSGRVLLNSPATKEVLFDFGDSKAQCDNDSVYGLPDLMYVKGRDFFLITIASDNHWLRTRQLPHSKQLEGIGRRGSFVLGIPYNDVRIRNVLLPPSYLDKNSLRRLLEAVMGISPEDQKRGFPWLSLYDKELDPQDIDFCELAKTTNEEEWLTL